METLDQTDLSAPFGDEVLIHGHAEEAMLQYALAVVKGRALPFVQDGQKPVQRRILYSMHRLGLAWTGSSGAKPVKGAKVVGDTLGSFHPHGDSSIYDALVRIAQDFSLRYPLIDGQGNFGSRDGDSAAAMRYTEVRLAPIADLLLSEIEKGTVDFTPNYDGRDQEPTLLPARLPFLLLNGASGIAVGMATECPSHNLNEVANAAILLLENPEATLKDVLQHIKGPDFPGGGQLISSQEDIETAYETGHKSLRCRARWVKEDLARGQWQVIVTELPHQVSVAKILEELEKLTNPQPKDGKKTIDLQQANLKQTALEFLEEATDESDKDNPMRLVLVPRSSKVDLDEMMAFLLLHTSLETSVPVNMTMVCLDGRPRTYGLLPILKEWTSFRLTTVRRRTTFELNIANDRIHVLEGRLVVFLNLDAVIKVIREADDPKSELMTRFALSEIQANNILEMRLRQLNKLEGIKLERELQELRAEAERLGALLASDAAMRALIVSEIRADAAKYGDERRTLIQGAARITASSAAVRSVPDEQITLVVSKNLWVKAYKGHGVDPSSFGFKPGDGLQFSVETRTTQPVYLLDSKGRAYQMDASQVPSGRTDGAPLSTSIELQAGAKIISVLAGPDDQMLLFGGTRGYGFIAPLKTLASRQRAGKAFITLQDDEVAFTPVQLGARDEAGNWPGFIVCGSSDGRILAFPPVEVNELNGGKGVKLMVLEEDQRLSSIRHAAGEPFEGKVKLADREMDIRLVGHEWEKVAGHRARKGVQTPKKGILL
ncbi:DNA topoisomerase IV subunit A [Roseateles asaccharophilus]|uniref:DNA topoisomerase IV subunit A n=1 Tax=Roseateles asaccharophilus TaxID=582607 RepID=UPI00384AAB75